ncbi:acyltransferase family protein [Corynebacterium heidelbergense]|uniref:Acyltransferase 3 domain-containing protein n=1 Tax=Corynebacterium heidelbergense TaxID=2055947 RepID=A0A364V9M9_9CORY|nr:acyltransferase family protein [Corynebacterium heidelbergense]RAV33318.1 hypothetical protein CWC39_09090 [Corynebacterium heidelbergense]WCZ36348.1 Acyltransferase family protein [Corynebacterium heidelbergense]
MTMSPAEPPAPTARQRLGWADTAKGLSIIGVCLLHVVTAVPDALNTPVGLISTALDPLRMPLFFMVSGLFAHRILQRSLADLWYRRLWFLLIPYLVFTPVQAVFRLELDQRLSWGNFLLAIVSGDPGLWFLHALILFNLAAWLLRKQPAPLAVALSCLPLLIGVMTGAVMNQGFRQIVIYAPTFFIGLRYRELMFAIAQSAGRWWAAGASICVYLLSEVLYHHANTTRWAEWNELTASETAVANLVRAVAAIPMGIVLAVALVHTPVVGRSLQWIGRHTLPVYVSHHAVMALVFSAIVLPLVDSDPDRYGFLTHTYPMVIVGMLACAAAGAFFYAVGKVPYLQWVLYPPPLPRRHHRPAGHAGDHRARVETLSGVR